MNHPQANILNRSNYKKCLRKSIQHTNETLESTTTPGQRGSVCNGDEGQLHIPQIPRTWTSPSDSIVSYTGQ